MIGIGIDTGGTYTDAIVYDLSKKEILASDKALTTKEDLKIGIRNVLNKLPKDLLIQSEMISLSTTLATNACVENRGGRGKLILIGVSPKTLEKVYADYGLESLDDIYVLDCNLSTRPEFDTAPDWDQFAKDLPFILEDCDCLSIVQQNAKQYHGSLEITAKEIIERNTKLPIIMGHELFSDLNAIKRGVGALLNAKLIPIIYDFLTAIKDVFSSFSNTTPPVIVRSDGTLMSEEFTYLRPVETLLCGPAASVTGALELAKEENALIVDMGGTTTDIAIVKNGTAVMAKDGIQIGNFTTFVKGLYVHTFGLGGDTAIHYTPEGTLYLEEYRIIPLCTLATNYPQILSALHKLSTRETGHSFFLHEFYCLIKDITDNDKYTQLEKDFCNALKDGPLILEDAAAAINKDIYTLQVSRLEKEGIIIRAGLTPTDIMHLKGDFNAFNKEASFIGAEFVCKSTNLTLDNFCDKIYDLIVEKLYHHIVSLLLANEYPFCSSGVYSKDLNELIHTSYLLSKSNTDAFFTPSFQTNATLIGIGAPIHIFLDRVATLLRTKAVIPKYASVVNALGAIVGNVSVTVSVELTPLYDSSDLLGYEVNSSNSSKTFKEYEEAKTYALELATTLAHDAARNQGACGNLTYHDCTHKEESKVGEGSLFLRELITIIATGKIV